MRKFLCGLRPRSLRAFCFSKSITLPSFRSAVCRLITALASALSQPPEQIFKVNSLWVKTVFDSSHRFDQCGVVSCQYSDNWLKASSEYQDTQIQHLGSVVTNHGYSDWATAAISASIRTIWYRLSRFISPAVNHRADEYGGSKANRARALVEILQGIRSGNPGLHISVKINCSDFMPGALTEGDSLEICKILAENGIDSIEVSGNGTSRTGIRNADDEAYFGLFAMRLAEIVNVPVILVGGLRSKKVMEVLLHNSKAEANGYRHITRAGHSLGANKVIHYLATAQETPVGHYILVSAANMKFMLSNVTEDEWRIIKSFVDNGRGAEMLPFPFMGWAPMLACTAWQWLWRNPLDNVHSDPDGDFSEVEKIRQTGVLIIGTYGHFSYGEPKAFIELINSHTRQPDKNKVIFVQGTGHVYSEREQMLANIILKLVQDWERPV